MECHEKWDYKNGIQSLIGLECLCGSCHEVKHIGLAEMRGRLNEARGHMMKVNGMTFDEANNAIEDAFATWTERNETKWKLDVKKLEELQRGINGADGLVPSV
jgi:cytochrome c2